MESDDGDSTLEIIVDGIILVSNSGDNENEGSGDSLSVRSSLSTQSLLSSSSSLGSSLKRMLSRNRSEQKVFPESNDVNELDA